MLLSIKLLSKYIDISKFTVEEIAEKLSSGGLEVEEIKRLAYGTNLVIGQILEVKKHPSSDHLHLLKVDVGDEVLKIVCGAPNVKKEAKVIVAKIGADLKAINLVIKKGNIRGEESNGMCCSLVELGVNKDYLTKEQTEGIEILGDDAVVGEDPLKYLGLDDTLLDIKLTPDRGDCMSIWGLYLDAAAILGQKIKLDKVNKVKSDKKSTLEIKIDTDACEVFSLRKIEGVKVKESPKWLKDFLHLHEINSINNIVDLGNYVMLITGQPIHMYDYDKLKSNKFVIKSDVKDTVKMLDEKEYKLEKGDVVITNANIVECVGGIIGSYHSMIDENTKNIVVEAASFNGANVRKTSFRLNLQSDSSQRFVKETDKYSTELVLDYLVNVLKKISPVSLVEETITKTNNLKAKEKIKLEYQKVEKVLGFKIKKEYINKIFDNLHFKYEIKDDFYLVEVPSRRNDLTIQEDLIEEIVRIYGFDELVSTIPLNRSNRGSLTLNQQKRKRIREYLVDNGLYEVMSYNLNSENSTKQFDYMLKGKTLNITNPITEDRKYLRRSLIPSLLSTIKYNKTKGNKDIAIFEDSKVYIENKETELLGVAINGEFRNTPCFGSSKVDYYTLKGLLEGILKELAIDFDRVLIESSNDLEEMHPYQSGKIYIDKNYVGYIGKVHPLTLETYDLDDAYVLELNLETLFNLKSSKIKFAKLDIYPSTSRDISMLVSKELNADNLVKLIKKQNRELIRDVIIFDIYEGENIPSTHKSIALKVVYQDKNKTLLDEEVNLLHQKVIDELINKYKVSIR